ncbi:DUF6056 family protein [Venatoribacter cucullus]|uniref:DUF6056 family protein n=1 Tax=Venatoribacter cucullus TaxID=2661630 RepID=UPI00223F3F2F|nr:DUF6056 family protein [Venatoribacter cucullus]UZK03159.1 hypothetical protein GAY96_04170 [Venatoribacter cucullus]
MSTFFKKNKYYLLSALLIYLLILIPSLYTPFQSDDYSYFLQGVDLKKRWAHYMGWSGRLITDFTSSSLLTLFPRWLYQSINAFIFLLLIVFISLIPLVLDTEDKKSKTSTFILWVIFFAYWIANPNLGQTSFWLVGSANYLWTIMWASAYILCLFSIIRKENIAVKDYIFIAILGFLAGCSNENTGVSVVLLSVVVFFIEKNKKISLVGLITSLLGTIVLIVAPGNAVRQKHFVNWYDQSTFQQLYTHIYERMPNAITQYLHIYLLLIVALLLLFALAEKVNKKNLFYALLFFILSLFSNVVLAKSPYIGGRNLNTGLFFLLPALAIVLYELITQNKKVVYWASGIIAFYCILFFIPSYVLFSNMMRHAYHQQELREDLIYSAKLAVEKSVEIPDWYFTKLLKNSDKFSTYRSGSMPRYYGVDSIKWIPINFNYAALKNGNYKDLNQSFVSDLILEGVYEYKDRFFSNKNYFIFEFNEPLKTYIKEDDTTLYIHLYQKGISGFINVDVPLSSEVKLGNKYYYKTRDIKANLDSLESINIGFYNSKTRKISFSTTIPL